MKSRRRLNRSAACALAVLLTVRTCSYAKAMPDKRQIQAARPFPGSRPHLHPQSNSRPGIELPTHEHSKACDATTPEPTLIVCILDRSGSMAHLTNDTIGGYNTFIEKQQAEPGSALVSTILFDNRYETLLDEVPLAAVKPITKQEYYARGSTALLDAVGASLMKTAASMEQKGICPVRRKVIFMIMTDGLENASREYSRASVKKMISDTTEKWGWQFIFLGANIDSAREAQSIGISPDRAMDFDASAEGVQKNFARMNAAVKMYRATGSVGREWKK